MWGLERAGPERWPSALIRGSGGRPPLFVVGVSGALSPAELPFAPLIPSQTWAPLTLDFTGPLLNHSAAGIPDSATLVTIGWLEAPDFQIAGFYVILHFNRSNPPVVHNRFYAG